MSAPSPGPVPVLRFPDLAARSDLETYVGRAKRLDPDGAVRLSGHGDVLAVYVCPLSGGGGPTVLGLRTHGLDAPADVDATVPLAALTDRFARDPDSTELVVPPTRVNVAWAGVAPPRRGWEPVGLVPREVLDAAVRSGVDEVARGTPPGAGSAAVTALRGRVWGRPLAEGTPDAPAGLAFVADALAFTHDDEPAALYRAGSWSRLTTSAGHVLARRPLL